MTKKDAISRNYHGNNQLGATLIEAVVSLFVFAVGALGIAALQTTSLVRVDDTKQRSVAIWKAQELADRMRLSKTAADPEGLVPDYITAIGNDNSDDGIGVVDSDDVFDCPTTAPTRCDDVNGTNASACSTADMVAFDIWSVMCDLDSGIAASNQNGSVGLRDVEVALEQDGSEFRLYLEWQSRSANNNANIQDDADPVTITTNLCGDDEDIDSRLDAYCLKIL